MPTIKTRDNTEIYYKDWGTGQPDPARGQRLDAWLKGPVSYDSDASLRAAPDPDGAAFAPNVEGEDRPAIVGRYSAVAAGSRLLA